MQSDSNLIWWPLSFPQIRHRFRLVQRFSKISLSMQNTGDNTLLPFLSLLSSTSTHSLPLSPRKPQELQNQLWQWGNLWNFHLYSIFVGFLFLGILQFMCFLQFDWFWHVLVSLSWWATILLLALVGFFFFPEKWRRFFPLFWIRIQNRQPFSTERRGFFFFV